MMYEFLIIPFTVIKDEWSFTPNPFLSTNKRLVKNDTVQIKLSKIENDKVEILFRRRELVEHKIFVKNNLFRLVEDWSDWSIFFKLTLNLNLGKFKHLNKNYEYEIIELNSQQYHIWISYNESEYVFSKYIR